MTSKFFLAVMICSIFIDSALCATESNYHKSQSYADQLYDEQKFSEALDHYLALAKKGDTFSQYRVSYIYLEGLSREPDLIEAFAWAALAAQNGQKELVEYRNSVGSFIPEKQHRKALRRVDYYQRKWGNISVANDAIRGARKELRNCTGSRVGTRCEDVESMEMPKFWAITPGDGSNPGSRSGPGSEGDGGGAAPAGSGSSAHGHGTGGSKSDVAYYMELREKVRNLNKFIVENSGSVELGEFKVLENGTTEGNANEATKN